MSQGTLTTNHEVPAGCRCDPSTWPTGIDPICDEFEMLIDENGIEQAMCLCGHDRGCHAVEATE